MNKPVVRQSNLWRNIVLGASVCMVLAGAGIAAWQLGLVDKAQTLAADTLAGLWGTTDGQAQAAPAPAVEVAAAPAAPAAPAAQPQQNTAPEAHSLMAPPASAAPARPAPVTAAPAAAAAPAAIIPVDVVAAPARQTPAATPAPAPVAPAPVAQQVPAAQPAAAPSPAPVLSAVREQLRAIDTMLASNPQEAMRRVEALLAETLTDEEAAEAGYRLGYAARMLRDEPKAEAAWKETASKYPASRGGRFSAYALAETLYQKYALERPQLSYWEDIQLLYSQVLGTDDAPFLPENVKAKVKANITRINDSLLFGSGPCSLAQYHKVESGELLGSIAGRYRVDYESIGRINGINPNRIRVGMDLKIIVGDVYIVVRKNTTDPARTPTVTWFLNGRWAREYPACVGETVKTPGGTYEVSSKEREPSWTNPANGQLLPNDHPENILGTRWMAIKGMGTTGLGIHGTTVEDSIPGYSSAGCVRLHNKDVEELFSFTRIGARVLIIE